MTEADPRAVIIANAALSLVALFTRDLIIITAALVCAAVFAGFIGADPLRAVIKLRHFFVVMAATAVLQSVFNKSGAVIIQAAGVALLTSGGLAGGALVMLRMGILVISGAAIASRGPRKNIQALIRLKIPYELAFMTYTAIYFIPLMAREMQDSLIAVQLRGIDLKRIPVRKRAGVYTYLLFPAVSSAIVKAQDLAASIELRGFRAYPERTSLTVLRMRAADYLIIALFACGAAAALIINN